MWRKNSNATDSLACRQISRTVAESFDGGVLSLAGNALAGEGLHGGAAISPLRSPRAAAAVTPVSPCL
jgi:hypothetical protein